MAIFILFLMITFLCGVICFVYPIKKIGIPTRKSALGVMWGSLAAFLVVMTIFGNQSIDSTKQVKASTNSQLVNDLEEETNEWNVHEFEIISDVDASFGKIRLRRIIEVISPSALTRKDRIATLIAAGQQIWPEYENMDAITLFLLPFKSGLAIAGIDYAPDKCGWTGKDCSNHVWTNAFATDFVYTDREKDILFAWETNMDQFMEFNEEYGFEELNESQLKKFLAKQFETDVKEISQVKFKIITAMNGQRSITIPDNLELSNYLNVPKQEISGKMDIEKEIQKYAIEPCILIMSKTLSLDEDFSDEEILGFMNRMIKTHMAEATQSIRRVVGNMDSFDDRLFVYNYFNDECSEIAFDIE